MDIDHVRSDTFKVDNHEYISEARRSRRCRRPWSLMMMSVMMRSRAPHRVVPGAGSFRDEASVTG